jgi:hypothetical protein
MDIVSFLNRPFAWLFRAPDVIRAENPFVHGRYCLPLAHTPLEKRLCDLANDDTPDVVIRQPANDTQHPPPRDRH